MTHRFFRLLPRFLPLFAIVGFSLLFWFSSPEQVLSMVGVENAYLLIFFLALIGGLSTFSGVPYHVILVALAAGGLDPFLLGSVTAVGVMLGDSTSYYLGRQSAAIIPEQVLVRVQKLGFVKERYPRLLPFLFFCFGALLPISNDIITIPMGILRYPFWKTMIPLGLGNLVFNIGLALLSVHAYELVARLPFIGG